MIFGNVMGKSVDTVAMKRPPEVCCATLLLARSMSTACGRKATERIRGGHLSPERGARRGP